jgi:ribonuclease HI
MSRTTLFFNGLSKTAFYPDSPNKAGRIACYGWLIRRGKRVLASGYGQVPPEWSTAVSVASYLALIEGLKALKPKGPIKVGGDSKLIINHMKGRSTPSGRLQSFYREAMELVQQLGKVTWVYIPRKYNGEAEALSWKAYAEVWEAGLTRAA